MGTGVDEEEFSQGEGEGGRKRHWDLTHAVLGACIAVHRYCGPGLLESVYEQCLVIELGHRAISFDRQVPIPLDYKGQVIEAAYRADLLVEGKLLVELKAVESLQPIHIAQVLTYLNLTGLDVGLLVNFNATHLRNGVRRLRRQPLNVGYLKALAPIRWPREDE
jgi:GxxExxY protein